MGLLSVVALLAFASTASGRENLCFTAHEKTALYCREKPVKGPLSVYDDTETPQRAVTMWWSRSGQLCTGPRACRRAPKLPVHVMTANKDLPRPLAIGLALVCLLIPAVILQKASKKQSKPAAAAAAPSDGSAGRFARVASSLLRFAAQPWFPWVAAAGTAINLFTIIFTGATVVLFLGAVLGRPKRWRLTALANALGATVGSAVLLFLLRQQGEALLHEQFPTVLASPAWAKTTQIMTQYGAGGMVLVASLPLILHPVIAFGILGGHSDATILGIILCGRTLKYLVMAYLAAHAPHALRYFGIKQSLFDMAQAAASAGKAPPSHVPQGLTRERNMPAQEY